MIPTLDSFEFENKTVLVRVDVNSHFNKKRVIDNERIKKVASTTLKELIRKKAKLVLMAHQGQKGEDDFVSLNQHARLLSKHLNRKVIFVKDVVGKKAKKAIKNLQPGDVLLLDNVRFVSDETDESKARQGKSKIVKALSPLVDIFVNDAFTVSHRAHASLIGFRKLPSCFGRLAECELDSVGEALNSKGINVYIFGGAKADDTINIMKHLLKTPEKIEYALTCGVTANIFMKANGINIGKKSEDLIKKKGYNYLVKDAKKLLQKYRKIIILPEDVAIPSRGRRKELKARDVPRNSEILDIGSSTIENYKMILKTASTIVIKGPAGMYEDKRFRKGTKRLFETIAKAKCYTLVGGGDTNIALDTLNINRNNFSHVSLGGGALINYLSGKPMPGLDAVMK